jgi:hypothetical protein
VRLGRFLVDAPADALVDHENRDIFDFRRRNLRLVSQAGNTENRGPRSDSALKIRGVTPRGERFRARVQLHGKMHNLGTYDTAEEASAAAKAFRSEHMPLSTEGK